MQHILLISLTKKIKKVILKEETVGICKLVFSSSSYHMWHLHMATKQETCFEFTGLSHLLMISGYQLTAQIDSKSSRWL